MEEERGLVEKTKRSGGKDELEVRSFSDAIRVFTDESKKQWMLAAPIAMTALFTYGINSSVQIFAGHLSALQLSAVSTALTLCSNFTTGFLLSMGSALETLSGQAFGAGQVSMLSIYMQRTWIILIISSILMSPIYIFATPILSFLGQQSDIAFLAGRFALLILPQQFAMAISYPSQKFLLTQNKVLPLAFIAFISLVLHLCALWFFTSVLEWGSTGAAIAFDVSSCAMALFQVIYIMFWCKDVWNGFSWFAFKDLWPFIKLSLSSAFMLLLGDWYGALVMFLTGLLNNAQVTVASASIWLNINSWEYMLVTGFLSATSVRLSNELGSGRPRAGKYAVIVSGLTTLFISLISSSLILATWDKFPLLFTSSKEVQDSASTAVYLLAIVLMITAIQSTLIGSITGTGWQGLVAYINLACYYLLGIPLAAALGFLFHWGLQGIWIGMISGYIAQTLVLITIVCKTNWKGQVIQAEKRLQFWSGEDQ
ncbi:protein DETOXIFICATION 34-like isoform X1 [Dioscorea cayenensis subsp. rotundata]|uniref:Protein DETOXIFICATION n=1 Tax=Dioscorea cayennensis subsp. rotundata TaxID=55577 RepID=A0AB40CCJ3_DIOCR|nr:protein DETOXIFICATION 34-like isoform X1 [Dioscorea cayenensis subsp. rotundata]